MLTSNHSFKRQHILVYIVERFSWSQPAHNLILYCLWGNSARQCILSHVDPVRFICCLKTPWFLDKVELNEKLHWRKEIIGRRSKYKSGSQKHIASFYHQILWTIFEWLSIWPAYVITGEIHAPNLIRTSLWNTDTAWVLKLDPLL